MKEPKGLMLTLPAQDLAAMLRFAVVPMVRRNDVPLALTGVHVRVGDETFAGFDADWKPGWAGVGATFASTDRFRMHVAGATFDYRYAQYGEAILRGIDVKAALVGAPRTSNDPAGIEWSGEADAIIRWPRSTFKVAVLTADFPKYRHIIDGMGSATSTEDASFTGKYVGDAITAASKFDRNVRVRMNGLRPAIVAPPARLDDPVKAGAIVMPVRMSS